MKFAVIIPTYQREDGNTPMLLRRALASVFAQTHDDFIVMAAGDNYKNAAEFSNILASFPDARLESFNLPAAVEREKYKGDPEKIWCNGGCYATNVAVDMVCALGCEWICRLDHDDHWLPNHLAVIAEAIQKTKGVWFCTLAQSGDVILPKIDSREHYVPFLPKPGGIFYSSVCFNVRHVPIREHDSGGTPGDYVKWQRMAAYIKMQNMESFCINELTCIYGEGGYERNKK